MLNRMKAVVVALLAFLALALPVQAEDFLEIKAFFTSRASNTTLADDPELIVDVPAGKYTVDAFLIVTAGNTGGFAVQMGGTAVRSQQAVEWTANEYTIFGVFNDTVPPAILVPYTMSGESLYLVRAAGAVIVSTGGTYSIEWAQAASSTTNTTVSVGSYLKLTRQDVVDLQTACTPPSWCLQP